MRIRLAQAVSVAALIGCACGSQLDVSCGGGDAYQVLSLIELIADPEDYHKTVLVVTGVAEIGAESSALFLHREDFENGNIWNAVSLDTREPDFQDLNGRYSSVRGCFRADQRGHLGVFIGSITEIERFVAMSPD